MKKIFGLAISLAAVAGLAQAQQVVEVGPGVVVLMPAAGAVPVMPAMPDPFAMVQQMDAMMQANMQQMLNVQNALLRAPMPTSNSPASEVVVTSFSNGAQSCTEQMVYPGHGAGQVQVTEVGNACGQLSVKGTVPAAVPASTPLRPQPIPVTAPSIQNNAPLVVADRN